MWKARQPNFLFRQQLMAKSEVPLLVADLDATVTIGGSLDGDLP
jgi:hypothetical protein